MIINMETPDGFSADVYLLSNPKNRPAFVVASWGGGWDHVSVSYSNKTPTWDEMAEIKNMFFKPDELCIQYHPPEHEYVNFHKHCLHIWRPQWENVPSPPSWMVGPKQGESISDAICDGLTEMNAKDE